MKLLLIEDDRTIGDILADTLTLHHWVVERAIDGEMGLEMALAHSYDLILLDIGLPRMDGIKVCQCLRNQGYENPILLLTGEDSSTAQIAGLDAGADDYITKPFDLDILLARLRAVLRKGKTPTSLLTWEAIQLDPSSGDVTCQGKPVRLTAKEYSLLELFLLNPRHIYSRRAILDHLWNSANAPGEETISTHIKCLRQKLRLAGSTDPIETVHGMGYRLRSASSPLARIPDTDRIPASFPPPSLISSRHPGAQQKAQSVTAKVWNRFKIQYLSQIQALEEGVTGIQSGSLPQEHQQEIRHLAHKLVGSMGMFGLMEASELARQIERLMQSSTLEGEQIQDAIYWVGLLRQTIEQAQVLPPPKVHPPQLHPAKLSAARLPSAHGVPDPTNHILMVDADQMLAERLRIEAIAWDFQIEVATDLATACQRIVQAPPRLILLDLNFSDSEDELIWLQQLSQVAQRHGSPIPMIVHTAREDLRDRLMTHRLGISTFLQKPLPANDILMAITDVLSRKPPHVRGDRVLIMDDDPGFLDLVTTLLAPYGFRVTPSTQPQTFWQMLAACHPSVLILDLEMPEFNGLDLCKVVRADPQWQHLKILFLSAHGEPETIAQAYAAGADDYISKSIPSTELIAHILHRLNHHVPENLPEPCNSGNSP